MIISKKEFTVLSIVSGKESSKSFFFADKELIVMVPSNTVNSRELWVEIRGGKVSFKIGCRVVPSDMLQEELEIFLSEEPITYVLETLKKKSDKKIASKSPIISESDDYFILATKKAYSKAEYYSEKVEYTKKSKLSEKTGTYNPGIYYDGYNLGKRSYVIAHLLMLADLSRHIRDYLSAFDERAIEDVSGGIAV